GEPLAQESVPAMTVLPSEVEHDVELFAEVDDIAQEADTPLEAERGQRNPPAVVDLSDDEVGGRAGAVEEDLVELGRAGDLADRANLDARLVHGDEQVGQAV